MALPGLSAGNEVPVIEEKPTTEHELATNTEWRFEVPFNETIEVTVKLPSNHPDTVNITDQRPQLVSGTAELFGTELAPQRPYTFTGTKAAIYTYVGARLSVLGRPAIDYLADETPQAAHANLHFALEDLRAAATDLASPDALGPRVLVVGPANAGKTSLVKLLGAYASRSGRVPLVANVDPGEGFLAPPGTLSAAALDSVVDVEEGWGGAPTSGPQPLPVKLPLVYYYGRAEPDAQPEIFKPLVRRLALAVRERMEREREVKVTGVIVDSAGSMSAGKGNYDIIQHVVAEFQSGCHSFRVMLYSGIKLTAMS